MEHRVDDKEFLEELEQLEFEEVLEHKVDLDDASLNWLDGIPRVDLPSQSTHPFAFLCFYVF